MNSPRLFPEVPYDYVKGLIKGYPYLDLCWTFNIDLKEIAERLRETKPTVCSGMTFDAYVAREGGDQSPMGRAVEKRLEDSKTDKEFQTVDDFSAFITHMEESAFKSKYLIEYYKRVDNYVRNAFSSNETPESHSYTSVVILEPCIKWEAKVKESDAKGIVSTIEATIEVGAAVALSPVLTGALLEYQSNLIFCYLVIADRLKVGVKAGVFARHLRVYKNANTTLWTSISTRIRIQYATLIQYLSERFYPSGECFRTKPGISMNMLADLRSVMEDASGTSVKAPFTVHQWLFRWVKDKLDAEVFSVRNHAGIAASLAILSEGEQNSVVELCHRFGSYRLPITLHHLERFLLQFGTTSRIRGALRLLNQSKYFPLWQLGACMEQLLSRDLGVSSKTKLVIAPLGNQSGSTAIIKYLASHSSLAGRLHFADDVSSALAMTKKRDTLYFVDDCLLSGTQTGNILGDLMGTRRRKPHHTMHCKALKSDERSAFLERSLVFTYCVGTDFGSNKFASLMMNAGIDPEKASLRLGVIEHSSSKAFENMGPVAWASADERDELKAFAKEVGYNILGPRAQSKGWDDARRVESSLGFSDFQRLLIFPYNVPKTTVTMLWEKGTQDRPWQPLFPGFD